MTMRHLMTCALALAAGSVLPLYAQTLNLKTGGWESSYKVEGQMQRLPAEVEKMPPAQRAAMEAALRDLRKGNTYKVCLTKQDLADMARDPDGDATCKHSNVKRSASVYEADMTCPEGRSGHVRIEALSSEKIAGVVTQKMSGRSGQGQMRAEFSARWASASCKGYDD